MFSTIYNVADLNIEMNKTTVKRKGDSSIIKLNKKCTTNNRTLGFQELCKEFTRKQIDDLKFSKFFFNNLIII